MTGAPDAVPARRSWTERILLCDFNVLGSRTGGQAFYANLIARHPDTLFSSLAEDRAAASGRALDLPANFRELAFRPSATTHSRVEKLMQEFQPGKSEPDILGAHRNFVKHLVSAADHGSFDRLDLPIYFPFVEVVKTLIDKPVRLTLHGMTSDGLMGSYEASPQVFAYAEAFRRWELASLKLAEEVVSVSRSHKAWVEETFRPGRDIAVIPPRDLLPGTSDPLSTLTDTAAEELNVLCIGRLDGIKRPHALIALGRRSARPKPRLIAMGMPLAFAQVDTGELLKSMSSALELRPAQPHWWKQFPPDDTVVVVPGIETLSYVALEAVMHGFTAALAPTVGAREIFDDLGVVYIPLEDSSPVAPLSAEVRERNARLLASVPHAASGPGA